MLAAPTAGVLALGRVLVPDPDPAACTTAPACAGMTVRLVPDALALDAFPPATAADAADPIRVPPMPAEPGRPAPPPPCPPRPPTAGADAAGADAGAVVVVAVMTGTTVAAAPPRPWPGAIVVVVAVVAPVAEEADEEDIGVAEEEDDPLGLPCPLTRSCAGADNSVRDAEPGVVVLVRMVVASEMEAIATAAPEVLSSGTIDL